MTGKTTNGAIIGIMTGMVVGTMTPIAAVISAGMTNLIGILGLATIGADTMDRTEVAIMTGTRESITTGMMISRSPAARLLRVNLRRCPGLGGCVIFVTCA
jgi:hypothetical protein